MFSWLLPWTSYLAKSRIASDWDGLRVTSLFCGHTRIWYLVNVETGTSLDQQTSCVLDQWLQTAQSQLKSINLFHQIIKKPKSYEKYLLTHEFSMLPMILLIAIKYN